MGNGVYQPKIDEEMSFVAFSQFHTIAEFFVGSGRIPLASIKESAEKFCSTPFAELRPHYHNVSDYSLAKYCFKGIYMYNLLTRGFGFAENSTQIVFEKHLHYSSTVSWALGMMSYQVDKLNNPEINLG